MTAYSSDILARGLDVVFCGLNPASSAARYGHNFSSRSNRFWSVLHLAGFTDVRLEPRDERRLLEYGCGITAVVARPTRRADEISAEECLNRGFTLDGLVAAYAELRHAVARDPLHLNAVER